MYWIHDPNKDHLLAVIIYLLSEEIPFLLGYEYWICVEIKHQCSCISLLLFFFFFNYFSLIYLIYCLSVQTETFGRSSALGWTNVASTAQFNLEFLQSDYESGGGTEKW